MEKNTYIYTLNKDTMTKQQIVRAESVTEAKSQIEDDLKAGWTVQSCTEDGDTLASEVSR